VAAALHHWHQVLRLRICGSGSRRFFDRQKQPDRVISGWEEEEEGKDEETRGARKEEIGGFPSLKTCTLAFHGAVHGFERVTPRWSSLVVLWSWQSLARALALCSLHGKIIQLEVEEEVGGGGGEGEGHGERYSQQEQNAYRL
jgi:hypothetical protein